MIYNLLNNISFYIVSDNSIIFIYTDFNCLFKTRISLHGDVNIIVHPLVMNMQFWCVLLWHICIKRKNICIETFVFCRLNASVWIFGFKFYINQFRCIFCNNFFYENISLRQVYDFYTKKKSTAAIMHTRLDEIFNMKIRALFAKKCVSIKYSQDISSQSDNWCKRIKRSTFCVFPKSTSQCQHKYKNIRNYFMPFHIKWIEWHSFNLSRVLIGGANEA